MRKIILVRLLVFSVFISTINSRLSADENKELPPLKIGVNRFAWYSALQTINFMPLISADPFSGVILSDWYGVSEDERYKIDIYILEESLVAETVDVRVFKQIKQNGAWIFTSLSPVLKSQIENAILDKARKLRIEYSLSNK